MWRSLQKQAGNKAKGTERNSRCKIFARWNPTCKIHFKCHFAHLKAIFAHLNPRCEFHSTMRNKVQNFTHLKPRCETLSGTFRTPQATFRTVGTRCEIFLKLTSGTHEQPSRSISAMAKTRGGLSASPSSPMPRPEQSAIGGATSPPAQDSTVPPSEGGTPSHRRYPTRRPPTDLCHPPPKPRGLLLGHLRRGPSSRVRRAIPGASEPPEDSRFRGIPLETVIRRPMIVGPPIEGNLDCRDRSFHSETCFDVEALRQQPSSDSFRLLRGVRNPTLIHFTIDGRQGAIGARHIAEALHIPYEPVTQADFREWRFLTSVLTRRELPSGMLLIDVLLRANIFPLQHKILEHLGYPEEPRLERHRHCERTSLDKWHHLVAYFAPREPRLPAPRGAQICPHLELPQDEQLPRARQDEILTDTTPSPCSTHLGAHARGYTSQHLSMQTPLGHDRSGPSEPPVPDEEIILAEQPIPDEEIRAEPSHDPTTI
ncbi:hypothetical protein AAG906_011163 [Vitis piasezkii]